MMKLSEFKAQYFPWSKEYKLREEKEAKERLNDYLARQTTRHRALNESAQMRLAQAVAETQRAQRQPSTSSSSGDFFTGMVAGAVIDHMMHTSNSSGSSSSSDTSSSWSSSSDSSSSWSDSSSSSWSDSSSSSWD